MSDPLAATPYEVLGVATDADAETLRRAFRRRLRETHPDTGGSREAFLLVQGAWEVLGDPDRRRRYDSGVSTRADPDEGPRSSPGRPGPSVRGVAGAWTRALYRLAATDAGIADPDDVLAVRAAPEWVRRVLAAAMAEEATGRELELLGLTSTVWHDVATEAAGPDLPPKLDHLVLGPTGLVALRSGDWGGDVNVRRGELTGAALRGERPVHDLVVRARAISRQSRVGVAAALVVVPDRAATLPLSTAGMVRGIPVHLVQRSPLVSLLREGLPDAPVLGGTDLRELRARLDRGLRIAPPPV